MDTTMEAGKSSDSRIRVVNPSMVGHVWDQVSEVMDAHPRGLLDGWYTKDQILMMIVTHHLDLWVGLTDTKDAQIELVALCRLEKYAAFSIYKVVWVGGKLKPHLSEAVDTLEYYASEVLKAQHLSMSGRAGWVRKLKQYGFKLSQYSQMKPVGRRH